MEEIKKEFDKIWQGLEHINGQTSYDIAYYYYRMGLFEGEKRQAKKSTEMIDKILK